MFGQNVHASELHHYILNTDKSSVAFTAVQNNADVTGVFEDVSGTISFHPEHLGKSTANIKVAVGSIKAEYDEVSSTLPKSEWLDAQAQPFASFKSNNFTHVEGVMYEAVGTLTLKNISKPITLTFELDTFTENEAAITGKATLNRVDFGVGWQSTKEVKNNVALLIKAHAVKQ